jgi:hypothetical protein
VVLPGELDQRLAGLRLHIGSVDRGQAAQSEPLGGDEVQHLKGVARGRLVVRIVADQAPAGVRGQDFRRQEVLARERALARPARADQDDERQLGDCNVHDFLHQP